MNIDWFIERIKSKWFFIWDIDFVKDFLNKNWYYHISSYIKCFCDTDNWEDEAFNDIDFHSVISLYNIDKKLQKELLNAVLKIETLLKANFIQKLCIKHQSPFWYLERRNLAFMASEELKKLVLDIQDKIKKSHACKHFFSKYSNEYLPIRHLVEFSSFGSFTKLFDYLKDDDLFMFCDLYWAVYQNWSSIFYDKKQLKTRLKGLADFRNRLAHSEITWSPTALSQIVLPKYSSSSKINTTSSYIQLIYHFLKMISIEEANTFYETCFDYLSKITEIKWIHDRELNKIWLAWNWEDRFNI